MGSAVRKFLKEECRFKVILLGSNAVGKSCLLGRYTTGVFRIHGPTIGAGFASHSLDLDPGVRVNLDMWDTIGLEQYIQLVRMHYHGVSGCLLVFDLTDRTSLENIRIWHDDICRVQGPSGLVFVLVGQKSDSLHKEVTREEAEALAEELGMPYVEVSAKTGYNVEQLFHDLARRIKDKSGRGVTRDTESTQK